MADTVLFLLPALPVGGAERQIAALVSGLDRTRFRPIVACQHALGPVADEIEASGVPVYLLSGARRLDGRFPFRLRRLLIRENVRIVLSHGFSTGVAARVAAIASPTRVRILAEHSTGERDMSPMRHRVNRLMNPLTSAWVAVAHGQLPYLTKQKGIPRGRIRVIPNGIDAASFRATASTDLRAELNLGKDAPVAGILAVLRPEKDHRTFLLAARLVADELPEARFLIVGDGPERADLERERDALDLHDHVHFLGRRADVANVLQTFDVSVLCSTDVETFPMAFLESMAMGLPLIGTQVGGLPEMITSGENGRLVQPRDPQGLARAMLEVLSSASVRKERGERSRNRVEGEFSLRTMVSAYERLFRELLD